MVYDAHYSINELIKDVGCLRTSDLPLYHTSLNDNDQLSLKIEQTRIDPTGEFFFQKKKNFFFRFRSFINIII
jgi:hypothetical protein